MEKTLLEWKANNLKMYSPGKAVFVVASMFFVLTMTGSIFGFFLACLLALLMFIPKKCSITDEKVHFWFRKMKREKIQKIEWDGPRARLFKNKNSRWGYFVLPIREDLVPKAKKILSG